jgi:lysophospholipase L1-like esterase
MRSTKRCWWNVTAAVLAIALLAGCSGQTSSDSAFATIVAFYGDSYTLGTGASDQKLRWSTVISNERDWTEFNFGVNGLGFINKRSTFGEGDVPSTIIDSGPDIVVVTMGLNDNSSYAVAGDSLRQQITLDLERLSDGLPDARIIVVEPFWYADERPESVGIIIEWVRRAAAGVGADYIPGASRWLEGHPEWMAADDLHPNDSGYAEIAQRMDAELTRIGL